MTEEERAEELYREFSEGNQEAITECNASLEAEEAAEAIFEAFLIADSTPEKVAEDEDLCGLVFEKILDSLM